MATNYKYEGEHVEVTESLLTHPTHTDGFVDSNDPVVKGVLVGVALSSAAAGTDGIVIATEGVFNLSVTGTDNSGNSAVAFGDRIYIDASTAALTKNATKVAFGIALGAVNSAATTTIAVKVCGAGN